jgi:GTP cyclohydrolase I
MIQLVLFGLVISYFFRAGNTLIEFSESSSDSESLKNTPKTEVDEYWEKLKSTNKEKSTSIKKTIETRGDWTDEFV